MVVEMESFLNKGGIYRFRFCLREGLDCVIGFIFIFINGLLLYESGIKESCVLCFLCLVRIEIGMLYL